jgi:uncharacterized protein (DUF2236 family)
MTRADVSPRINAERVALVGWLRALLLQIAHPLIAAGVADHSTFRASSAAKFGRLQQTIDTMLRITFGTVHEREQAIEGIRTIHRRVHGTLAVACGVFPAGTPYSAQDPTLLLWVHATLVESVVLTFEQIVGPLTPRERDEYCADSADVAIELGAEPEATPRSWDALRAYLAERYASGEIVVGHPARVLSSALLAAAPGWLGRRAVPPVMSLVAAGMLPPHIRDQYGLPWSNSRAHLFAGVIRLLRALRRVSPDRAALWHVARSPSRFTGHRGYSAPARWLG